MRKYRWIYVLGIVLAMASCRHDEIVVPSEYELLPIGIRDISTFANDEPIGMYLLNEGNMGSNKASIDYLDFVNGYYIRNIYSERNPNVVKELGNGRAFAVHLLQCLLRTFNECCNLLVEFVGHTLGIYAFEQFLSELDAAVV